MFSIYGKIYLLFHDNQMPQCTCVAKVGTCGKGTRSTESMESTLRLRQRTSQLNSNEKLVSHCLIIVMVLRNMT